MSDWKIQLSNGWQADEKTHSLKVKGKRHKGQAAKNGRDGRVSLFPCPFSLQVAGFFSNL
jgi:hypothetical protein